MVKDIIKEEELSVFTIELISTAQNFIWDKNGVSSVSLREIRRFIIFYEFFIKYLNIREEIIIGEKIKEKENEIIKYSKLTENEINYIQLIYLYIYDTI